MDAAHDALVEEALIESIIEAFSLLQDRNPRLPSDSVVYGEPWRRLPCVLRIEPDIGLPVIEVGDVALGPADCISQQEIPPWTNR